MIEHDLAIANGQWLKELGRWANGDSHDEIVRKRRISSFRWITAQFRRTFARWETDSGIYDHRLLLCDSGHQDACWSGILDPIFPPTEPARQSRIWLSHRDRAGWDLARGCGV